MENYKVNPIITIKWTKHGNLSIFAALNLTCFIGSVTFKTKLGLKYDCTNESHGFFLDIFLYKM